MRRGREREKRDEETHKNNIKRRQNFREKMKNSISSLTPSPAKPPPLTNKNKRKRQSKNLMRVNSK